jgi:hypothetical protein
MARRNREFLIPGRARPTFSTAYPADTARRQRGKKSGRKGEKEFGIADFQLLMESMIGPRGSRELKFAARWRAPNARAPCKEHPWRAKKVAICRTTESELKRRANHGPAEGVSNNERVPSTIAESQPALSDFRHAGGTSSAPAARSSSTVIKRGPSGSSSSSAIALRTESK